MRKLKYECLVLCERDLLKRHCGTLTEQQRPLQHLKMLFAKLKKSCINWIVTYLCIRGQPQRWWAVHRARRGVRWPPSEPSHFYTWCTRSPPGFLQHTTESASHAIVLCALSLLHSNVTVASGKSNIVQQQERVRINEPMFLIQKGNQLGQFLCFHTSV